MFKKLLSSQFRINIVASMAAVIANLIILAIAYPVYIHFLGYEKYGVWLILSTVLNFAQFGNLGISSAIMKIVAEEHGRENTKGIQSYIAMALSILLFSGIVVLMLILLLQDQIISVFKLSSQNNAIASQLLPYISVLVVCVMLTNAINATLAGLGRMDLANYIRSGGRLISVVVASSLLLAGGGISSLLIGNTCSYIFILTISLVHIYRILNVWPLSLRDWHVRQFKNLIHFAGGMFGSGLVNMTIDPFNKLILSRYVGVGYIPIYEIAFNGGMQIRAITEAGLRSFIPEVSRIYGKLTKEGLERIKMINRRANNIILTYGLAIHGAVILFSKPLLKIWLGKNFVPEQPLVFQVMIFAAFLSLLCVPAYYTIVGLGKVRHCLYSSLVQAGTNIAIVIVLMILQKELKVADIAFATLAAMGMTCIYILFQKHRLIKALAC